MINLLFAGLQVSNLGLLTVLLCTPWTDNLPSTWRVLSAWGGSGETLKFFQISTESAFKANTRNKTIDVTDYEGSEKGWRVVKEFAWEHQMPLKTELRIGGKKLQ